jgi:hypothetical protein
MDLATASFEPGHPVMLQAGQSSLMNAAGPPKPTTGTVYDAREPGCCFRDHRKLPFETETGGERLHIIAAEPSTPSLEACVGHRLEPEYDGYEEL